MALVCPRCGSPDVQGGLHELQCLGCGQKSDYGAATRGEVVDVASPDAGDGAAPPVNPAPQRATVAAEPAAVHVAVGEEEPAPKAKAKKGG